MKSIREQIKEAKHNVDVYVDETHKYNFIRYSDAIPLGPTFPLWDDIPAIDIYLKHKAIRHNEFLIKKLNKIIYAEEIDDIILSDHERKIQEDILQKKIIIYDRQLKFVLPALTFDFIDEEDKARMIRSYERNGYGIIFDSEVSVEVNIHNLFCAGEYLGWSVEDYTDFIEENRLRHYFKGMTAIRIIKTMDAYADMVFWRK